MTVVDKERDECVSLLHAVEEIQARHGGNLDVVHRIIIKAYELGDLDLRLQRPDGSITDRLCDVIANLDNPVLWDELFQIGLLNVSARPPQWRIQDRRAMRRVQPDERSRIVVIRDSLKEFMQAMPLASTGDQARAIEHLGNLLKDDPDMKRDDAYEKCKQFKIGPGVLRTSVWPKARKKAGLPIAAKHGRKRKRKSAR